MEIKLGSENELLMWKIQDVVTIQEAVLLAFGVVPEGDYATLLTYRHKAEWPKGMFPLARMLANALESKIIEGTPIYHGEYQDAGYFSNRLDIDAALVSITSVQRLFNKKNILDQFFNDTPVANAEYLDVEHACYAPKLHAAVNAWQAIAIDSEGKNTKTPKQNIEIWLRKNAQKFDLAKDDGTLNEHAIEQIAKIINWRPEGGVVKTPSGKNTVPKLTTKKTEIGVTHIEKANLSTPKKEPVEAPFDDEIPF